MRVCFVSFEYPPFSIGGAGVYAVHITRELAKLGHEVHVISPSIKGQEIHSVENDVFVHRIPTVHKRFLSAPSFWFNLARKYVEIRKDAGGFDVLHGNGVSDFSLLNHQVNEPRVVTIHHLARLVAQNVNLLQRLIDLSGETGFTPMIEKVVISRADKIIAVSNFTKKTLVSTYNVPPSKIEIVPHGINVGEYLFSKDVLLEFRKLIGLDDYFAFLFVGRLDDPRKNLLFLLRAFRMIDKKLRKSIKLVLVGAGDYLKVKSIAHSFGIEENLILLGYVDDFLTLRRCYGACDVFVSPSLLEGFGLTILEAMAAGKPVIALRRGAIPEIVKHGENGLLVDGDDPRELADAMIFLADHKNIVKQVGKKNREYITRNFSWEKSARLVKHIYESLLDST